MKKMALFLAPAALCLYVGVSSANAATPAKDASATELKIGVIDVSQVLQDSPQMEQLAKKLKTKFKPRQEAIIKASKKVDDEEAKLKKDGAVMSQSDLAALQDQIVLDKRKLRQLKEDYVQDAKMAQSQAMNSIVNDVDKVVKKIADDQHFDLVLQRNNVAFASNRVNITPDVIKAMKAQK
ncbi:MAG: hypothetical protein CMF50_00460 [Legionellales bacterium]|nr:hypothetical protein [Legionellales bacterium]|tara:strand:+ start:62585 stop:63127 length:543 start_codon:yes stop_codon:yes gene_type:complete